MIIDVKMNNDERAEYIADNYSIGYNRARFIADCLNGKLKNFNMEHPTVPLPLHHVDEHLSLIPSAILDRNVISEDGKYFIVNGEKIRKSRFFKQWLGCDIPLDTDGTSGKLYFTVDPAIMLAASDEEFVSWSSCYRPGGEHWYSCVHCAASPNVGMVMILDSDHEKILGRRFAILVRAVGEASIFLLPVYGNMPKQYRVSAQRWFIQHIFNNDGYSIVSGSVDMREAEEFVVVPYVKGSGEFEAYPPAEDDDCDWWLDATQWIIRTRNTQLPSFTVELPDWLRVSNSTGLCACCGNSSPISSMWESYDGYICDWCKSRHYVYSPYLGLYIKSAESKKVVLATGSEGIVHNGVITIDNIRTCRIFAPSTSVIREIIDAFFEGNTHGEFATSSPAVFNFFDTNALFAREWYSGAHWHSSRVLSFADNGGQICCIIFNSALNGDTVSSMMNHIESKQNNQTKEVNND